ncbi:D-aminoacyl-tRNA deacylase [Pyrus ussuriensis x Pyrus communis]|uniref:D-aminoacyl-tRNA deacylase n=1 Tax=Pyrus ussuriensis x Pyrus communis TaxID=2448454 RepID=A0A5N5HR15_9ROSA|nr:D-aminoacyl-tRNA deacylase [Pyrus ussuriensis x Pyrus communis]
MRINWWQFLCLQLVWEGLGLEGGAAVGNWNGEKDKNKVLLGLGGGHYAPRHIDIVLIDFLVAMWHGIQLYSLFPSVCGLMHNLLTVN